MCIDFSGTPKYVRLGDLDIDRSDDDAQPQEYRVKRVIIHPEYRQPIKYNDIALIELSENIEQTFYVGVACLDTIRNHTERKMTVTGWGKTEFSGQSSSHLLKAELDVVDNRKCRSLYRPDRKSTPAGIRDDVMICAGGKSDTCYVRKTN